MGETATVEERQAPLLRLLRAIAAADRVIVRERNRTRLLEGFCRVAVEEAGFRMAWIGFLDEKTRRVVPAAVAGHDEGYVAGARIAVEGPRSLGPTGRALAERRTQVLHDMAKDERFAPWRAEALARGYRSSMVIPLQTRQGPPGVLNVYSAQAGAFRGEAATLLEELASNLAFALDARAAGEQLLHLAAVVETANDAILTKSIDGTILTWNSAAERLYGWTRAEAVGSPVARLVPKDRLPELRDILARVARGEEVAHRETERLTKDGRRIDVSLTVSPLRDEAGEVVGASAIARDVTARRRGEEAARRASLYARSLIEASLDPLVTIGPEGAITDVNRATEQATGVPRARLVGTDFSDYFTEPERAREGYRRVFAEGEVRDYPLTMRHVSGATTDVLYNASLYRDEEGTVQGIFAAARDVTDRKRAEEALRDAMRDLERSNAELEQFAYVASHDLQEPLRAVSSFTQLLAQRYGSRLDETAREYIGFAADGAARMRQLITDLLAYSRIGTRGRPPEPVEARDALQRALANLSVALAESGAEVKDEDLPVVRADAAQLVQLFQNLVGNAVKFRRAGEPARVLVAARREGDDWVFSVRDNGIGIAREFFERVFVIFQRLHTRDEYGGTGIGLALCRRIVERHGGRIWLESEPGSGSTFFFTLPAR